MDNFDSWMVPRSFSMFLQVSTGWRLESVTKDLPKSKLYCVGFQGKVHKLRFMFTCYKLGEKKRNVLISLVWENSFRGPDL